MKASLMDLLVRDDAQPLILAPVLIPGQVDLEGLMLTKGPILRYVRWRRVGMLKWGKDLTTASREVRRGEGVVEASPATMDVLG